MTRNPNTAGAGYRADGVDEAPVPFSDYLRVLGRRKLLLVVGLIIGLAAGATYAKRRARPTSPRRRCRSSSLPANLENPSSISVTPPNMETESTLAVSDAVAAKALSQITSAHKTLTTKMILNDVAVSFPNKSTILTFKCTASNPTTRR